MKLPTDCRNTRTEPMLEATCHCGAVRIQIPQRPVEVTNCNCSICRRLGTLWAYYPVGTVKVLGHPEHTEAYVQGDKTLRIVRCKTCGCTTHWEPIGSEPHTKLGVNIRMFDPAVIGEVSIRLLDGADTWKSYKWEDLHPQPSARQLTNKDSK